MSNLDELYRLQKIDNHIARFKVELKKLAQETPIQSQYAKIKAELDGVESELKQAQAEQKKLQDGLDKILKSIEQCDARLFSGTIGDPKELTHIQKDREQRRNQQIKTEDKLLEVMETVEELQQRKSGVERRFRPVEAEHNTEAAEIAERRVAIASALESCAKEREKQAAVIDEEWLEMYRNLARKGAGVAMGRINDGVCGGCFVTIPTALTGPVRKGDEPVFCDRCGRILYWEKPKCDAADEFAVRSAGEEDGQ